MPSLIFPKHGVVGVLSRLLALEFVSERRQAGHDLVGGTVQRALAILWTPKSPPFSASSGTTDYRDSMSNFLTYDFGYTWSLRYAMLVPLILAGGLAGVAALRSWPRWV